MVRIKCQRGYCGYVWNTKSEMDFVSCPKCLTKVKVVEYIEDDV